MTESISLYLYLGHRARMLRTAKKAFSSAGAQPPKRIETSLTWAGREIGLACLTAQRNFPGQCAAAIDTCNAISTTVNQPTNIIL